MVCRRRITQSMSLLTAEAPLFAVPTQHNLTDELYLLGWLLGGFFSPGQTVGTLAALLHTCTVCACHTSLPVHLLKTPGARTGAVPPPHNGRIRWHVRFRILIQFKLSWWYVLINRSFVVHDYL